MEETSTGSKGFSFKFSKTTQPSKVDKSKIQDDELKKSQELDFVKSVEDREIQSSRPAEKETELIIPLITKNVWRTQTTEKAVTEVQDSENQPMSLDEQALKEIIEDTKRHNEEIDNKLTRNESLVVPLLMQNKVPEGFETDDRLDVSLRPDPSNLDDYDKVPIEHFGLAALKGMGWKPGEGIGRTNKKCVAPVQVTLRPRGLGLGANVKDLDAIKASLANHEFPLVVGAYVSVVEGNNKGKYGQIQSMDEETGRVVVHMAEDDRLLTLPEIFLKGVSKKDFQKESVTTNKSSYDERVHESAGSDKSRSSNKETSNKKRKHKDRSRSVSPSSDKSKHHKKKKKNKDRHRERSESPAMPIPRIHPQLKMRIIDQKYKNGRYYKAKVVIEDVITPTSCICRTEDGKLLEDVDSKMLETVIPRTELGHVMVLDGKYKGRVATILNRDKSTCTATLHLLPDHQTVLKLSYDSICEFVGDVSIYE